MEFLNHLDWGVVASVMGTVIVLTTIFVKSGKVLKTVENNSRGIEKLDEKIDNVDRRINDRIDKVEKRIDKKIDKVNERIDDVEKRIDKKIDMVNERIDKVSERIEKVNERFRPIEACLAIVANRFGIKMNLTNQNSPLTITKKGWKVAKSIDAQEAINEIWAQIIEEIKNKNLTKNDNAYDVQKACFDIGMRYMDFVTEPRRDTIKTYAVKKGYDLYDFNGIFGIIIRDKFFKENEIDITS